MESALRVLHFSMQSDIGGIETFIHNIWSHIDQSKIKFDIITECEHSAFEEDFLKYGCKIHYLPSRTKHPILFKKKLTQIIKDNHYKIVHIHKNSCADLSVFNVCKKLRVSYVIAHSHNSSCSTNSWIYKFLHLLKRYRIKELADIRFACSDKAAEWFYGKKLSLAGGVKLLKVATDVEKFKYDPVLRDTVRSEMQLNGKYVIGHVGRFSRQKNHTFLINIFYHVYAKNNNAVLLLIGDGDLLQSSKTQVKILNLSDAVVFLGARADTHRLYQAMDLFVFPSLYEGFPAVVLEAQVSGLPCIISDTITREIMLSNNVKLLPINILPDMWANEILSTQSGGRTQNTAIKENGYDIQSVSLYLERFYLNLLTVSNKKYDYHRSQEK